jgi:hypothetical protein
MNYEVLCRTSRGSRRFTIDGTFVHSLSETEQQNEESIKLFVSSLLSLLSDSPLGPNKPPTLYSKFIRELQENGVKATIIRFTDLAHKLVSQPNGHILPLIGPWIEDFKNTPIFFEYNYFFKTGDIAVLRWIYTFLNFGKKMEFVDPSFDETAFRGWSYNEERLRDLVLPQDTCASLQKILRVLLPTFDFTDFRPKFGPGSVSEKGVRLRLGKISNLSFDSTIDRVFFHGHIGKYGMGEESGLTASQVIPDPTRWSPDRGISSRTSRLMFVPKNVKTSRSICMEPNTLMFFQQGVMSRMCELLRISELGTFIRLKDQSFNRKLSQLGSKTGLIDTLDLSSASDCLSYDLVKKIFPPSWQIVMRATRSNSVLVPSGDVLPIRKFAPMGSALCFPTQCIVFCAVGILSACLYSYEKASPSIPFLDWLTPSCIKRICRDFWQNTSTTKIGFQPMGIYGDDICIDSRLTPIVIPILTSLGFLVNEGKSFFNEQLFRESCGGFYLGGHDITPLYFSIKGVRKFTTPEHVASQVHMINECWNRMYKNTYRFLRRVIMTWDSRNRRLGSLNPIPHVSEQHLFGILCSTPHNSHLEKRYNKNYQRDEARSWTITYTEKYHPGNLLGAVDKYEYMRWWVGRNEYEIADEDLPRALRYDTGRPGLLWRWIPQ